MISRNILAAVVALWIGGAALAQVDVNAPGVHVRTPAGGVDLNVKVGAKVAPTDAWVGRAVYSSDGKHLGEVAAVADDQMYLDIGGFLGIGESRVLLSSAEVGSVADDRIVLKLTENEATNLPATDKTPAAPK